MATYKPENSAHAIRQNGPHNPVRSISYPELTFQRGAGREWISSTGKTYDNFGSLICEWISGGLEDCPDPYEEAVNWFKGRTDLDTSDLLTHTAKTHAVQIIKKAIPTDNRKTPQPW